MVKNHRRYVLCIHAKGDVDLEERKLYQVLPDERAAEVNYIRVIDESGEDYLYPARFFIPLELSKEADRALHPKPRARVASQKPRARVAAAKV